MYLYVSLCIFMYLLKSVQKIQIQKIQKDTKRYMYLLEKVKRYKKIKDTKRYMYLFVSFEPVSKDIKIH